MGKTAEEKKAEKAAKELKKAEAAKAAEEKKAEEAEAKEEATGESVKEAPKTREPLAVSDSYMIEHPLVTISDPVNQGKTLDVPFNGNEKLVDYVDGFGLMDIAAILDAGHMAWVETGDDGQLKMRKGIVASPYHFAKACDAKGYKVTALSPKEALIERQKVIQRRKADWDKKQDAIRAEKAARNKKAGGDIPKASMPAAKTAEKVPEKNVDIAYACMECGHDWTARDVGASQIPCPVCKKKAGVPKITKNVQP